MLGRCCSCLCWQPLTLPYPSTGKHQPEQNFVQSLTFPWSILLVVQVLPEEGLKFSFLL